MRERKARVRVGRYIGSLLEDADTTSSFPFSHRPLLPSSLLSFLPYRCCSDWFAHLIAMRPRDAASRPSRISA